ncbi:MAG: ROK family protein [Candidatus Latescibacterota bacterium]|nr:MAG: ROK family protein [Candidatus Latescibacterota bacterium]
MFHTQVRILGFDVGGTKTAVVVGNEEGEVTAREEFPSEAHRGPGYMISRMLESARKLLSKLGADVASVSIGGPLLAEEGRILGPANLPGWDDVPLKEILQRELGIPAYVEHDAKCGALAEWYWGAAKGAENVVFLTPGTGLGAGMILGGRLYRGAFGWAGECGHWRMADHGPFAHGKVGSWEAFCGGVGIAKLARYMFPCRFGEVTAKEIAELARSGDPEALAVVRRSGEVLGRGLSMLIDLLAPDIIVVGSLAHRLGELWLGPAREVVMRESMPGHAGHCRIVPTGLGERLGDCSALCAAVYQMGLR